MAHLVIPRRFNGPANSGNGGWTSGAVAALLEPEGIDPVTVRLLAPPPLDTPLLIERHTEPADTVTILAAARPVATAAHADFTPTPVEAVPVAEAVEAEKRFAGHRAHPFPTCFTCGPRRRSGDGLRIFAGPVAGRPGTAAATWTPYASSVPITWAALDCPGAWAGDVEERPVVLGTMTAQIRQLPSTSERYVVVAEVRAVEGRKTRTAATIYGADGRIMATAEHIWVTIDPADFR